MLGSKYVVHDAFRSAEVVFGKIKDMMNINDESNEKKQIEASKKDLIEYIIKDYQPD